MLLLLHSKIYSVLLCFCNNIPWNVKSAYGAFLVEIAYGLSVVYGKYYRTLCVGMNLGNNDRILH